MKLKKGLVCLLTAALVIPAALTGCGSGGKASSAKKADLNKVSVEEIEQKAKEEGQINSAGMPDDWANWADTWKGITGKYGLKHTDVDLSSAEELSMFQNEKKNATKDIGDVGEDYAYIAKNKGLSLPYKTSYWDQIPDWAKDDDGYVVCAYYGNMAIMTNKKLVKNPPRSFQDMLDGDYKVSIGDVNAATRAQYGLLAAARAFGGDEKNLKPGLDFFKRLAQQGRLDKGEFNFQRIEKGEIQVAIIWDFQAIGYREQMKANGENPDFDICIPSDGSVMSAYSTVINAYTRRPYAAALAREYILSDEGQLNLAKGYAKTVRKINLPDDLKAKMIPDEEYKNVYRVKDSKAWSKATAEMADTWNEEVMAYAK